MNPNFNQVFIIGGNDWLSARAAFSHDPFEGMGLVTSEKSSKRHEKKLMGEPVDNESESLKSVCTLSSLSISISTLELTRHSLADRLSRNGNRCSKEVSWR